MLKIRRPLGRLIFNMGIAIPGKTVFLIETAPWFHCCILLDIKLTTTPRNVNFSAVEPWLHREPTIVAFTMFMRGPGRPWGSQIANTLRSTSIKHRSDAKVSDRCLIDVDLRVLSIWDGFQLPSPHQCKKWYKTWKWFTTVNHFYVLYHFLHRYTKYTAGKGLIR